MGNDPLCLSPGFVCIVSRGTLRLGQGNIIDSNNLGVFLEIENDAERHHLVRTDTCGRKSLVVAQIRVYSGNCSTRCIAGPPIGNKRQGRTWGNVGGKSCEYFNSVRSCLAEAEVLAYSILRRYQIRIRRRRS